MRIGRPPKPMERPMCNHCTVLMGISEVFIRTGNQIFHPNCYKKHLRNNAYLKEVKALREVKLGRIN